MRLDAGMSGAILSCNVVATHKFSSHNYVTRKKKEFYAQSKNKKAGNSDTCRYTSRYLNPNFALVI